MCCLVVATYGGTRTFGMSLSDMFMLILCLFRGVGVDLPTSRGWGAFSQFLVFSGVPLVNMTIARGVSSCYETGKIFSSEMPNYCKVGSSPRGGV